MKDMDLSPNTGHTFEALMWIRKKSDGIHNTVPVVTKRYADKNAKVVVYSRVDRISIFFEF